MVERHHSSLRVGQLIEVRKAAGARASWSPAKLLELDSSGSRRVEYEAGGEESIPPAGSGEPCNVRPRPPSSPPTPAADWKRGLHLEALRDSSWEEGVFLGTQANQVEVFFPGSGEKLEFPLEKLRVSQSWNDSTNAWEARGYDASSELPLAKPQRTFQRKKKRKVDGEVSDAPVAEEASKRLKQEPEAKPEEKSTAPAEEEKPAPIEYVDVEPMQGVEDDEKLDGEEEFRLTNTLPIPVCCINTQSEDPLFGDLDSGSQGGFFPAKNSRSLKRNISLTISRASRKKRKAILENHRRDSLREARENAIRNLESSGWRKALRERQRENRTSHEAYYIAPDGTSYHSLTSACAAWMQENKDVSKSVREAMQSYQMQIVFRRSSPLGLEPGGGEVSNNGGSGGAEKLHPTRRYRTKRFEAPGRPRLSLMPRKKINAGEELEARRLTLFSWLIDSGVVPENAGVFSLNGELQGMGKGVFTRDGVLCRCCSRVFNSRGFQLHGDPGAGRCSASRIVLEDGRSLLNCQQQALRKAQESEEKPAPGSGAPAGASAGGEAGVDDSDECCGLCGEGGELICCDSCPATYHLHCVLLKSVPDGDWYCPKCRCPVCGLQFEGREVLFCTQCERSYHVHCLNSGGLSHLKSRFCSQSCLKIYSGLREVVGISTPMEGGYSWTIVRSCEEDGEADVESVAEHSSKLALALTVMQECFSPMIDPRRKVDIITHILKNRSSDVKRLDFRGFYCFSLERRDELISVAAIRIHGTNIAEMPLIGTRLQFRRQGMCRRLMEVIEQVLRSQGVETLILPAVPELLDTWTGAFGFQKVTPFQSVRLLDFNTVGFPGTSVLHKPLTWLTMCRKFAPPLAERPWIPGNPLQMGVGPEPQRKPRHHKPPALVKTDEFSTPAAAQNHLSHTPGSQGVKEEAQLQLQLAKEEPGEDSRIVLAKTRSNRLVKASKRVVEALNTLKNKSPEDLDLESDAGEEEEFVEKGGNELSFLRLGSSQIVMSNTEATPGEFDEPVRSSTSLVALNTEVREPPLDCILFEEPEAEPELELEPEPEPEPEPELGPLLNNNKESSEHLFLSRLKVRKCTECGTSETPMWRRAHADNMDLCNACGIRRKKMYMRLAASEENEEI